MKGELYPNCKTCNQFKVAGDGRSGECTGIPTSGGQICMSASRSGGVPTINRVFAPVDETHHLPGQLDLTKKPSFFNKNVATKWEKLVMGGYQ